MARVAGTRDWLCLLPYLQSAAEDAERVLLTIVLMTSWRIGARVGELEEGIKQDFLAGDGFERIWMWDVDDEGKSVEA